MKLADDRKRVSLKKILTAYMDIGIYILKYIY
jgi:hypothetical protein